MRACARVCVLCVTERSLEGMYNIHSSMCTRVCFLCVCVGERERKKKETPPPEVGSHTRQRRSARGGEARGNDVQFFRTTQKKGKKSSSSYIWAFDPPFKRTPPSPLRIIHLHLGRLSGGGNKYIRKKNKNKMYKKIKRESSPVFMNGRSGWPCGVLKKGKKRENPWGGSCWGLVHSFLSFPRCV